MRIILPEEAGWARPGPSPPGAHRQRRRDPPWSSGEREEKQEEEKKFGEKCLVLLLPGN
ncbi:hypothetical protein [Arthrobacter bussei]|uniref:hypothetical protein n=1 Tax=Arthrobacter bussei TaxID=2594179 RepID=UPI00177FF118|nr:hypothetical protein [Arthrobacter bussei]